MKIGERGGERVAIEKTMRYSKRVEEGGRGWRVHSFHALRASTGVRGGVGVFRAHRSWCDVVSMCTSLNITRLHCGDR